MKETFQPLEVNSVQSKSEQEGQCAESSEDGAGVSTDAPANNVQVTAGLAKLSMGDKSAEDLSSFITQNEKLSDLGVKKGSEFENVVLAHTRDAECYYSTGRLLVGVKAIIWQGTLPESYLSLASALSLASSYTIPVDEADAANGISYCFSASDLSEEVYKIDSSMNGDEGIVRSGLRLNLRSGPMIEFYFADDEMNRSKKSAQRCVTLLKCLLRTVVVQNITASNDDDQSSESSDDDITIFEDDEDVAGSTTSKQSKRKINRRKNKNRRTSLTLDALQPFMNSDEIETEDKNAETESHTEPVQVSDKDLAESVSHDQMHDENIHEADLRDLVRRFAAVEPDCVEAKPFADEILARYNYEVSTVKTPTKKRIENSPPKKRAPTKADLYKLKPIVIEMTKRTRAEKREIQNATQVVIKSPKGDVRHFQYIDATSKEPISPSAYGRRYLRFIGVDVESPQKEQRPIVDQITSDPATDEEATEIYFKELKCAEELMHEQFEEALIKFVKRKADLDKRLKTSLLAAGNSLDTVDEIVTRIFEKAHPKGISESEALNVASQDTKPIESSRHDSKENRSMRVRKKSKSSRRKSVSLEDVLPLVDSNENEIPFNDSTNKRVIWSAR